MHLASVSNQIQCYDWPKGSTVRTYQPKTSSSIKSASWANNAGWMCVVTSAGNVELVSFKDKKSKFLYEIEDVENASYATFQSLNKRDVAIACGDHILIYDMKKSVVKKKVGPTPDRSNFFKLMFDSRDTHLCAGARNDQIYVYNAGGLVANFYASNTGTLTNFTLHDQMGMKVAACTNKGACILWELDGITNIYSEPTKCAIRDLVFRDNALMYITEQRTCVVRDLYNTSTISKINLFYTPKCIDMCVDAVNFAICGENGTIYAYDVRNLYQPINKIDHQPDGEKIVQIAFCKHDNAPLPTMDDIQVVHEYHTLVEATSASRTSVVEQVPLSVVHYNPMPTLSEDRVVLTQYNRIEGIVKPDAFEEHIANEVIDAVRSAVKEEMTLVKNDLKRHVHKAVLDSTRANFYDLRMALVKEFVKIQDILDRTPMHDHAVKGDESKFDKVKHNIG